MESRPPHHTNNGFRNVWIENRLIRRRDVFRWMKQRRQSGRPNYTDWRHYFPVAEPDWELINRSPAELRITWLGHATCLIQIGEVNILTDPVISERCSPAKFTGPRRVTPFPIALDKLPPIDYVVISHNHYDHLDVTAVNLLGNAATWLVPLGIQHWLGKRGVLNVIELDWWESATLKMGGQTVCLPAKHFSSRSLWDRNRTLWASWLLMVEEMRVYFAGDTGYEKHFKQVGNRYGPLNLAILPIGAYRPEWFMLPMHLSPEQAVQAHLDLGAEQSLGVHWGTFILSDEPMDEPPRRFLESARQRSLSDHEVFVMQPGQTRTIRRPDPPD